MSATVIGTLLMVIAVIADIIANVFTKKSKGFRIKPYAVAALGCVSCTVIFLGLSIQYIELSVAYTLFGAIGILVTTALDKAFFGLYLRPIGILGILTMISGIFLLQTA